MGGTGDYRGSQGASRGSYVVIGLSAGGQVDGIEGSARMVVDRHLKKKS